MALSFYSDWEADPCHSTSVDVINSPEVADALIGFVDPPLFTLDDLLNPTHDNTIFSSDHCVLHNSAKHHRSNPHSIPPPPLLDQSPFGPFFMEPPPPPAPTLPPPITRKAGDDGGGGSLSVQSIAARERRKRISEKTQQLSRLIPRGRKMNTAEMLQAGNKYVRYLQAQSSILGLMMNSQKADSGEGEELLLQVLMDSEAVQERLSNRGMCLVPKEMVSEFAADPHLNPIVKREINKFIIIQQPISEKKQ